MYLCTQMIPFELLPLYQVDSYPNKFWTAPRNTTDWNLSVRELAVAGNEIAELLLKLLAPTLPDAHVGECSASLSGSAPLDTCSYVHGLPTGLFDSHTLFQNIVDDPGSFLNGTAPFNVTGCVQSCVFELNESLSDPGVCTFINGTDRDSYVWWVSDHITAAKYFADMYGNGLIGGTSCTRLSNQTGLWHVRSRIRCKGWGATTPRGSLERLLGVMGWSKLLRGMLTQML